MPRRGSNAIAASLNTPTYVTRNSCSVASEAARQLGSQLARQHEEVWNVIQILSQIFNFFWNLREDGTRLPKMANEIIAIPTLILATESAVLKNCTTTACTQRSCQAEEPARGKKLTACEQIKCEVDLGAAFAFTTSPQIVQRLKSPKPQHLTLPSPVQMYCAKPESQSVRMSVSMYVSFCSESTDTKAMVR